MVRFGLNQHKLVYVQTHSNGVNFKKVLNNGLSFVGSVSWCYNSSPHSVVVPVRSVKHYKRLLTKMHVSSGRGTTKVQMTVAESLNKLVNGLNILTLQLTALRTAEIPPEVSDELPLPNRIFTPTARRRRRLVLDAMVANILEISSTLRDVRSRLVNINEAPKVATKKRILGAGIDPADTEKIIAAVVGAEEKWVNQTLLNIGLYLKKEYRPATATAAAVTVEAYLSEADKAIVK